MKVTSQPNLQAGANDKKGEIKPAIESESSQPTAQHPGVAGSAPSFQSILDKVYHPRREGEQEHSPEKAPQKEPSETKQSAESKEKSEKVRTQNDLLDEELPNNLLQGIGGDVVLVRAHRIENQLLTPREILPVTDLEKIVLSVRTHLVPGGQPQVTIALPRSLLEGLRVNLSVSQKGRVTAEFLAPNDIIRSQIDARSNDLADMLRARGINLEALKTSVNTELSGNGDGRNQRGYQQTASPARVGQSPSTSAQEPAMADERVTEPLSRITYRA
jgi:hypothetical protein